jgi:hypothetical protein
MNRLFCFFALCLVFDLGAYGQTTLSNLDDQPITNPNQTATNVGSWGYSIGSGVGCASDCTPSGSMSHTSYYSVDGSSLQLNLANPEDCAMSCYGDLDFPTRIYQNSNFTLDLYVTMDSVGIRMPRQWNSLSSKTCLQRRQAARANGTVTSTAGSATTRVTRSGMSGTV